MPALGGKAKFISREILKPFLLYYTHSKMTQVKKNIKPLDVQDHFHLQAAEGWLGLGDVESASNELREVSPAEHKHPAVLSVRYQIYAQAKQWDEAVAVANDLMKLLPEEP